MAAPVLWRDLTLGVWQKGPCRIKPREGARSLCLYRQIWNPSSCVHSRPLTKGPQACTLEDTWSHGLSRR